MKQSKAATPEPIPATGEPSAGGMGTGWPYDDQDAVDLPSTLNSYQFGGMPYPVSDSDGSTGAI